MADLTTEMKAYLQGLANTNFAARPLQAIDMSTLFTKDIPVKRNAAAKKEDLNTLLEKALP